MVVYNFGSIHGKNEIASEILAFSAFLVPDDVESVFLQLTSL